MRPRRNRGGQVRVLNGWQGYQSLCLDSALGRPPRNGGGQVRVLNNLQGYQRTSPRPKQLEAPVLTLSPPFPS